MKASQEQVRWFRLRRGGLVEPFGSPEEAAHTLAGIQAQMLPAAGLSLWNRTRALTYAQLDTLLHDTRTLVKLWGQRHTLHLYPSDDWPLIYAALRGQSSWWERTIEGQGGDVDGYRQLIEEVAAMMRERGTMGRSDLRAAELPLDEWHLSSWGGVFSELVRGGHCCHAGQVGNEGRFAHREYWLPDLEWDPPGPEAANAELLRRYLRAYGPATLHDFAYWRGARVVDARKWAAQVEGEVVEVDVEGDAALLLRDDMDSLAKAPPPVEEWPVRLLYRFDPFLLPHKDKSWLLTAEEYPRVWRPAGHIEGTLLEHGRIRATWRYDRKGKGLVITVHPFSPLSEQARKAIDEQAPAIASFFEFPLSDVVVTQAIAPA